MNRTGQKTLGWLLCLAGFAATAAARQSPAAGSQQPAPATQQQPAPSAGPPAAAAPQKEAAPDYSQEPFVVEQYYTTARFEDDGTGVRDLAVRIRVQSDAGVQQLGELVFGYNSASEQMDVRYVRVRKPDGSVVNATPDAIKELTAPVAADAPVYTDYKEKHITVPGLHPGDTLEYDIATRTVTAVAPGQFWFQHDFLQDTISLDERLVVNIPEGRKLTLASSPDFPFEKKTADGRTIYTWKHSTLSRPSEEEEKNKKKPAEPKAPDVQLTTFQSWEEVARWYAKLEQDRVAPTPEIRAKTAELIAGRATDLDKMQALYDYVAKNIRYVSLSFGLGRYQPHAAGEVFANQYGDCKDKHTLLAAMLAAAGIPSDAVLISSSRKLDESMPSPSQFDHVITAVPEGKDLIWMDATAEVAPFRLLTAPLRDKSALLVPPDRAGKIVTTPADPPFLSTQNVEIDGQVSELGKLTAHLHYSLRGDTEFVLRSAFRQTPQTQWKDLAGTILSLDGVHGDVASVKPSDPSDTRNPLEIDIEFTQSDFLDWSNKEVKVALPLVSIGLPDVSDDNTDTIKLGSPLDVTTKLKLTLPANYTAQAPVAIAVKRDYAEFSSDYSFENHTLTAARTLDFKMRELPASRTTDYMAFSRAVESDENQTLAVRNATPGPPEIPAAAKSDELIDAGLAALNAGNPRAAIPLFQRVVQLEPQHKQAWNDLGLAYLRVGQFDDAAAAFHKQLEVNPYDEHSWNFLGVTLEEQQKYDDAAAAFRKQLEVNPLDSTAHAALGGLLLSQHQYADALPELEKATILSPDDADLQVSLGQAYLNTGRQDKALAAFERGAEISQTPNVWNNVAYSLADNKIQLDKAQQYAESAVSATAANLRNVELAHLTMEDLRAVESLAAYWDTLGWVYFRKGDLDTAERYIRAAWTLSEHGEVGDHLAQIYQKRGEKDKAVHAFAMALAAPHSVPETRARLILLLGGNSGVNDLTNLAKPALTALRTVPAGKLLREDLHADFFLLFSPGEKEARVDGVQFVSGSDKLRPFADRLRGLDYPVLFPDSSPVKIVRRGTLSCSAATGDCTFLLILPEDVRTIN